MSAQRLNPFEPPQTPQPPQTPKTPSNPLNSLEPPQPPQTPKTPSNPLKPLKPPRTPSTPSNLLNPLKPHTPQLLYGMAEVQVTFLPPSLIDHVQRIKVLLPSPCEYTVITTVMKCIWIPLKPRLLKFQVNSLYCHSCVFIIIIIIATSGNSNPGVCLWQKV